jgi:glycosyltransferase involved in cell wall biosynthesis
MKEPREIKNRKVRVFTCTPVDFTGDESFFSRDSGLLCRGLQLLGIESKAVMPGFRMVGDLPDLIRTEYKNLEDPKWWKSHQVDAVILYSWADPRFSSITEAVKKSGAKILLNIDSNGVISPYPEMIKYYWYILEESIRKSNILAGVPIGLMRCLKSSLPFVFDIPRINHLQMADVIGCVAPIPAEIIKKHLRFFKRDNLLNKIKLLPHPVQTRFSYSGMIKRNQIISIGRWTKMDAWQKDPELLMSTINLFLMQNADYNFIIVGRYDSFLREAVNRMEPEIRDRIRLTGIIPNDQLNCLLDQSKISLCVSFQESFHIASAESLCCGASIVSHDSPYLSSFPFFIEGNAGTLATVRNSKALVQALENEVFMWNKGDRDPFRISQNAVCRFHSSQVALQAIKHLDLDEMLDQ